MLGIFVGRGISGYLPAVILLFTGALRAGVPRPVLGKGLCLLLFTFFIMLQPFLGGPAYTEGDFIRLSMLGYLALLAAVALWLREGLLAGDGSFSLLYLVPLLGVASSFHHIYSFLGGNDSGKLGVFLVVYFGCQALLLLGALCLPRCKAASPALQRRAAE
jgi:hypothetical protein